MGKMFFMAMLGILAMTGSATENLLKNGDFESCKNKTVPGFDWIPVEKQKYYEVDHEIKHSGKASLKISGVSGTWIGFPQYSFKVADFKRPLLIRGWAKYENLAARTADGKICGMPFVGLWSQRSNGRNSLTLDIPVFAEGSKDWFYFERMFTPEEFQKRSSHMTGDNAPATITFRINVASQPGTVWFDDLEMVEVTPEPLAAALPLKDVSTGKLAVSLTRGAELKSPVVVLSCGTVTREVTLKDWNTVAEFPIDTLAPGAYQLTVTPKTGFPETVKPITLNFTKQADAFAE